jgi:hypothetical protein
LVIAVLTGIFFQPAWETWVRPTRDMNRFDIEQSKPRQKAIQAPVSLRTRDKL